MIHHKITGLDKALKTSQIIILIFFFMLTMAASQQNTEDKVDSLIKKLQSKNSHTRARTIIALGKLKDARVITPLINALNDTDSYVRGQAVWALGEIKDPRAVQPLITVLKDDDYLYVRQESAKGLGKIKDRRAVQPLINALNDEHSDVREEAVKALIEIGAPVSEQLNHALKEKDLKAVADAYYLIISVGEPGTEDMLIGALHTYGNKRMAKDFINCGNMQLKEAAYKWAKSHSYKIEENIGARGGPKWERFKSQILLLRTKEKVTFCYF
jgi:HEAT repeat protein